MRINKAIAATILGFLLGQGAAEAASLDEAGAPAEPPPASFEGTEYVDSRGCVYSRASFGGKVIWVPRVTPDREVVCGRSPTIPPTAAVAETRVGNAEAPVNEVKPAAKVRPKATGTRPVRTARAPKTQIIFEPEPTPPLTARKSRKSRPANERVIATAPTVKPTDAAVIPRGFRLAWEDDRLNPNRAVGTAEGEAEMALVWTNEVPRRLIVASTGQDVTRLYPQISYPNWGYVSLPRGATSISSKSVVRIVRAPVSASPARQGQQRAKATAAPKVKPHHRYVQVGVYREDLNAHRVIARLVKLKLPVRTGHYTQRGEPRHMILAGPFSNEAALRKALATARRAGFKDAFLR